MSRPPTFRTSRAGPAAEATTRPRPSRIRRAAGSAERWRIRTTVGICTAPFVIDDGKPVLPLDNTAPFAPTGPYNLSEGSKFPYCKRPT